MTKDNDVELAPDDEFVDLGEVSVETEGQPGTIHEGAPSVSFLA